MRQRIDIEFLNVFAEESLLSVGRVDVLFLSSHYIVWIMDNGYTHRVLCSYAAMQYMQYAVHNGRDVWLLFKSPHLTL